MLVTLPRVIGTIFCIAVLVPIGAHAQTKVNIVAQAEAIPGGLNCAAFPGAEDGAKIQACLVALNTLNSQAGRADASGLIGCSWAVNPFAASSLPASGVLLLPPCQITTCASVVIPSYWSMGGLIARNYTTQSGTSIQAKSGCFHVWASPDAGTITTVTANS